MEKLEKRLTEFYTRYLPSNSQKSVSEIARKYLGKEENLFKYLHKKYADKIESVKRREREELDFLSNRFDPQKALLSGLQLKLPMPNAAPLDNLHKCRSLLPQDDENFDGRIVIGPRSSTEHKASNRKKENMTKKSAGKLSSVADCFQDGPMSLLRRCFRNQDRICVRTRAIDGERGRVVGSLDAFDKHMNLILRNVIETQIVKIDGSNLLQAIKSGYRKPASLKGMPLREDKKYFVPVTRTFQSLLVRGDMVMLIYLCDDAKKKKKKSISMYEE